LVGSQVNLFNFGGEKVILDRTKNEWQKIKNRLDAEAACPIGLLYKTSFTPLDDHQVLAIGYEDNGFGNPELMVWDNNDGSQARIYKIDFNGDALEVDKFTISNKDKSLTHQDGSSIKGFFLENYSHVQPPVELKI